MSLSRGMVTSTSLYGVSGSTMEIRVNDINGNDDSTKPGGLRLTIVCTVTRIFSLCLVFHQSLCR